MHPRQIDLAPFGRDLTLISTQTEDLIAQTISEPNEALLRPCAAALQEQLEELQTAYEELQIQNESIQETIADLSSERDRYEQLFHESHEPYLRTNEVGKITDANNAAATAFNISPSYLRDKVLATLVPPEHRKAFRKLLRDLQQTTGRQNATITLRPRGATMSDSFVAAVLPLRRRDGSVEGFLWHLRPAEGVEGADETGSLNEAAAASHKTQEDALPQRTNLTRYLAAQAALGQQQDTEAVWNVLCESVTELCGGDSFLSLLSSDGKHLIPVAATSSGPKSEAIVAQFRRSKAQPLEDKIARQVIESKIPLLVATSEVQAPPSGTYSIKRSAINMLLTPVQASGNILGVLSLVRSREDAPYANSDITIADNLARYAGSLAINIRAQVQAQQNAALSDKNRNFLLSMCHDLQEPVHAICGYAGMLLEQAAENADAALEADAAAVFEAAREASDLLADIFAVARLQSGVVKVRPERIPALELISDLEIEIQNAFGREISIEKAEFLDLLGLKVDPIWSRQAVLFVLKATGFRSGTHLTCTADDSALTFVVEEDPGPGPSGDAVSSPRPLPANQNIRYQLASSLCALVGAELTVITDEDTSIRANIRFFH